jgi:hypothetical protein
MSFVSTSVADSDPIGPGPFWSDPDPDSDLDVWDRIPFLDLDPGLFK